MATDRPRFWTMVNGFPGRSAFAARIAEENGWDGVWVPDTQNLSGDPYVALAVAAHATTHLLLKTGATNPYTRHPAVTATSIASVQEESNGRAHLGIGRGDSSLAYLGLAPVRVDYAIKYIETVQSYLRLESVPFNTEEIESRGFNPVADLSLAAAPTDSKLRWLRHATSPKASVEVVASGPRMISAAARIADKMTFAVGADPVRVQWAIDIARESRAQVKHLNALEFGVHIGIVVDEDRDRARVLAKESLLAGLMRFSVMHGKVTGPVEPDIATSLLKVHEKYDMRGHGRRGSQLGALDDNLVDAFSIAGPPNYCVERLLQLIETGITSVDLVSGWGVDSSTGVMSQARLTDEVLPRVRRALA
jgi:5,10-methylenetetrahydromethanopterin reductase